MRLNSRLYGEKMMDSRLLGIEEMAKYLGVSQSTLYAWVNQEKIPHIKVGWLVKFDQNEIESWLKEHSVGERKW